jgi:hypothetical protein
MHLAETENSGPGEIAVDGNRITYDMLQLRDCTYVNNQPCTTVTFGSYPHT